MKEKKAGDRAVELVATILDDEEKEGEREREWEKEMNLKILKEDILREVSLLFKPSVLCTCTCICLLVCWQINSQAEERDKMELKRELKAAS